MTGALYCSVEDVKSATDVKATAYQNTAIYRTIEAASRSVEGPGMLNRKFAPEILTRTFDYPEFGNRTLPWRVYTGDRDLLSLTSITAGGTALSLSNVLLRPDDGPYSVIEISLAGADALKSGTGTWQRAISMVGLWGYSDDRESAGTVVTTVNASVTTIDLTANTAAQTGSILVCGTERMQVTARAPLTTAQTGTLTLSTSAVTLAVSDGTAFVAGETLLIDSERVLVEDISANNLTVQRAYDGSVLAAHTAATIYSYRRFTVTRGAYGSTAAAHTAGATVETWAIPSLLRSLTKAESIVMGQQDSAAWARTVGSGESERESSGRGLRDLRASARASALRRKRLYGGAV